MARKKQVIERQEPTGYLRRAPYAEVPLDPTQRRQWEDTLSAFTWIAPGFINVMYTMMSSSSKNDEHALFTHQLPATAGTDGIQLIINPLRYFKYHLLERVFINLHEVMHEILNHCRLSYAFRRAGQITFKGKALPWDDAYANRIQDYVINAVLVAAGLGRISKDWLFDPKIADDDDHWIEVYFRHWKNRDEICRGDGDNGDDGPQDGPEDQPGDGGGPQERGGSKPKAPGKGRFDCHLDPGQSIGGEPEEHKERNEQLWEIAVNTAMEIQRAQGKLPGSLERFFKQLLEPKVDWTEHIKGKIVRLLGAGAYDWRRLDRRLITRGIGAPGITGHGARLVVVGGDTSMSVFHNGELVSRFCAEIGGMLEDVNPEQVLVLWCDTEVKRDDMLEDVGDLRHAMFKGVPGGGGTSFVPVFDYIAKHQLEPDCLIYLTDGDGRFPANFAADYPVIWGDISGNASKYPFGEVVRIPVDTK